MKVGIFGGHGGGEIAAMMIHRLAMAGMKIEITGYLNDRLPIGQQLLGGPVLCRFDEWKSVLGEIRFIAPLHKVMEMSLRRARIERLEIPAERWMTLIDPQTAIANNATVSHGTIVGPFSVIGPSSVIGRHVAIWPGAQIGHDAVIQDYAFVGRNSIISGYCRIGRGAFIGSQCVVREGCVVGEFSIVGAGSTVLNDVADGAMVAGNPARPISSRLKTATETQSTPRR